MTTSNISGPESETPVVDLLMSLNLRDHIVKSALELCGLEMTGPDTVTRSVGKPRPEPRVRLAAMRILATAERQANEEKKLGLLEYQTLCARPDIRAEEERKEEETLPELSHELCMEELELVGEINEVIKASQPPVAMPWKFQPPRPRVPERLRKRSSLSPAIRNEILKCALAIEGFAVTSKNEIVSIIPNEPTAADGGEVEAATDPRVTPRLKLAALRVLAGFRRLGLEERRVEIRFKRIAPLERVYPKFPPELEAKWAAFQEKLRQYDKEHGRYSDDAT
jgi:hypothetical protein